MRKVTFVPAAAGFVVLASLALASAAPAGSAARTQRVTMEATKTYGPGGGTFVLARVNAGPLMPDSGTFTFIASGKRAVRNGQSVAIFTVTSTWTGKRGTFVLRERIDDVAAGRSYRVGTGVWSLLGARGTGQYARMTGSGGSAYVVTPPGRVFFRFEGSVTES